MSRSAFIQQIIDQAKVVKRNIVLPEGSDDRVLEAANIINREQIASITLLGNQQEITEWFSGKGYRLEGIRIIDPEKAEKLQDYADAFYELRKAKGITPEQALDAVKHVKQQNAAAVAHDEPDNQQLDHKRHVAAPILLRLFFRHL